MKYRSLFIRWIFILAAAILAFACSDDDKATDGQTYGYAQFYLSKNSTRSEQLEYLNDVSKVRVVLLSADGNSLSQTLNVSTYDDKTSEYGGMQSEKWMLLAGTYNIVEYELFDALENPLMLITYDINARPSMEIISGGLSLQELLVNVIGRGEVSFQLVKDNAEPETRVDGVRKYPFFNIAAADITVKCLDDNKVTKIEKLPMKYKTISENKEDDIYYTGVCVTDSIVSLPAGRYTVTEFRTFFDKSHNLLLAETCSDVIENIFIVPDNDKVTADVPVTLDEASDYLKDAYAIYEIWKSLDGPNWYYKGTTYPVGSNWEFDNRDIDLWLAQPGVKILDNGRVASINLTGFGAKGHMSSALGELSELRELTLGTHKFSPTDGVTPSAFPGATTGVVTDEILRQQSEQLLESFMETYVDNGHPLECFAPEMYDAFIERGPMLSHPGRETVLKPFAKNTAKRLPLPTDQTSYATLVYSLPEEIKELQNLKMLSIAFSPIEKLPEGLKECKALTDVHMFSCPKLVKFPDVLADLPKLTSLVFSNNRNLPASEMERGLKRMNDVGRMNPDGHPIQILQMPGQACNVIPDLKYLSRIGLLNVSDCGITRFEAPFAKNQSFSSFIASRNEIETLPVDGDGFFVGMHGDFEALDFSRNKFKKFPNIFLGNSLFIIGSVNFSFNEITMLEGADDNSWKGINTEILNLSYNKFDEFPDLLFTEDKTCSQLSYLQLQGNNMTDISEKAFEGRYSHWLMSLDLSMNKLTDIPESFNIKNMPYLYGLDLSYNRFDKFMTKPLNCASLGTYLFKGQRDAHGRRCMRDWPIGIGKHIGMRRLFLASNDIRKVNDDLSYMIYTLDISDNPNISIDVSALCPYITAGMYMLIYDPNQDIQGCDALDLN